MEFTILKNNTLHTFAWLALVIPVCSWAEGWNPNTSASNVGSIVNTRHNLMIDYSPLVDRMSGARNDYGAVCIYCHTPHGASTVMGNAPLWNRTKPNTAFTLYSATTTLNQEITEPGSSSLMCLSCHDGITSLDSIINMPGSGRYRSDQQTSISIAFLNTWSATRGHFNLQRCSDVCHNATNSQVSDHSFESFIIGADLSDDHPVGVDYPTSFGSGVDFRVPSGITTDNSFFDVDGDNRLDKNEIRTYSSGGTYKVECGSCHDPHGVESNGSGSEFIPSFLRVNNQQSALCMTCHIK